MPEKSASPRWILHVDLDSFFVSVERVLDPSLKGKPVIVGGYPGGRGVVAAASYEARDHGVHSAMPLAQAKRLCPHAVFLPGNHEYYARASKAFHRLLERFSPLIEIASIDEAYLDITGLDRLCGHPVDAAHRLRQEIAQQLRLSASVGLSASRLVSKIASGFAKPAGFLCVFRGMERRFLAPLDVRKMPGVGKVLAERLKLYGLRTIGDIARIDRALVAKVFGKVGGALHDRAQGLDNSPVEQRESVKSMSRERTFETDTLDADFMESTLRCLIETLGGELRKEGLRARSGTLKVRYSDFRTQTCSVRFPAPTDVDDVIYTAMKSLFRAQATRRVRVRLVGVALSGLCRDPWQLDLFHQAREQRMRALCECLDGIREKYGFSSILRLREKGYERRSAFPE